MKNQHFYKKGSKINLSRREFMAGCAACAAYASTFGMGMRKSFGAARHSLISDSKGEKPKVRLVFSHIPPEKPTWPNIGYDYEGRKKEFTTKLQKALPGIDFSPVTVQSAQDAEKLLQNDRDADGYVVYLVGIWTGAARKIASSGKPVLLVDDLYAGSGEFLIEYARALREGHRVVGVSSSRFEDVVEAVGYFQCIKKLRSCTILDVTDSEGFWGDPIRLAPCHGFWRP